MALHAGSDCHRVEYLGVFSFFWRNKSRNENIKLQEIKNAIEMNSEQRKKKLEKLEKGKAANEIQAGSHEFFS